MPSVFPHVLHRVANLISRQLSGIMCHNCFNCVRVYLKGLCQKSGFIPRFFAIFMGLSDIIEVFVSEQIF